ncbi:helix-turn-helix transcriptional regulator [Streptomyces asoensis]|uniref:Helix-turn-helix transcriptional regulator n=1 Tax=Streptomyces asoensis TaxID=249586 RepID=A0A6M4X865_9ACTN|nr:helix-turn-helix transcriptional regulator [Streptomyces asoensis]QJT04333.1 helix-turn-helix transcriptional regulator [Streptomyces asoensis]
MLDPSADDWLQERRHAIGDRIRTERIHRNLTQERLHLAAGISRWSLQELEAGRSNPTLDTLLRIARALDTPLADLVR